MRYGILSDIHGNIPALEAVLDYLAAAGISRFLVLGDIVGYGADPNPCCDRVRSLDSLSVHGNHDLAAVSALDLESFNDRARRAAEWTIRELSPTNRGFLRSLPAEARGDGFQIVHGSLTDPPCDYITDKQEASACLELQAEPLCFFGHTHVPALFARPEGSRWCAELSLRPGIPAPRKGGHRYAINCGAVGQPRDGNPDGACGIYDSGAQTITLARVPYPIADAQARIRRAGLPGALADRLALGM